MQRQDYNRVVVPRHPLTRGVGEAIDLDGEQHAAGPALVVARPPVETFVKMPKWILLHPTLSKGAKLLHAVLVDHAGVDGGAWPGQHRLARLLGCSIRSVQMYVAELVQANAIEVRRPWATAHNRYRLNPEPTEPVPAKKVIRKRLRQATKPVASASAAHCASEADPQNKTSRTRLSAEAKTMLEPGHLQIQGASGSSNFEDKKISGSASLVERPAPSLDGTHAALVTGGGATNELGVIEVPLLGDIDRDCGEGDLMSDKDPGTAESGDRPSRSRTKTEPTGQPRELRDPVSADPVEPRITAQTIVRGYVDRASHPVPRQVLARLGREAKALIEAGFDPELVEQGCVVMQQKNYQPGSLPSFVNSLMQKRPAAKSSKDFGSVTDLKQLGRR